MLCAVDARPFVESNFSSEALEVIFPFSSKGTKFRSLHVIINSFEFQKIFSN